MEKSRSDFGGSTQGEATCTYASLLAQTATSLKKGCLSASAAVIRFFGLIISSLRSKSKASLSDSIPLTKLCSEEAEDSRLSNPQRLIFA